MFQKFKDVLQNSKLKYRGISALLVHILMFVCNIINVKIFIHKIWSYLSGFKIHYRHW